MPASVSFTGSARNARQSSEDARAVRQGQKAACVFDEYLSVLKDRDVRLREQAKLAAGILAREPGIGRSAADREAPRERRDDITSPPRPS